MKQNFTLTICYFLYLGIAIFIHPVKSYNSFSEASYVKSIKKQQPQLALENTEILHSELLFKF